MNNDRIESNRKTDRSAYSLTILVHGA